ncbi:MAG: TIR domain-containing protein [Pyrinomonadaceae bacterium]
MSDIFLSYSREDRPKAEALALIFAQQGWSVWWDKIIPTGKNYSDVISGELAKAKAVIVLWSQTSAASSWVRDEATEGNARGVLVPVLIENLTPPLGFRQVQTADLSRWDTSASDTNLQGLLTVISGLINKPVVIVETTFFERLKHLFRWPGPASIATAFVVILLAGFATYRFTSLGGALQDTNKNHLPDNINTEPTPRDNVNEARVVSSTRVEAAELTAKGINMASTDGNHEGAILIYNEAIALLADYAPAYFFRGESYATLRRNDPALADFDKVMLLKASADLSQRAKKLINDIKAATPNKGTNSTFNLSTSVPTNSHTSTISYELSHALVGQMFSPDTAVRIEATTKLVIAGKQSASIVQLAVKTARENTDDKSGVINTLVLLKSIDPTILKNQRTDIEQLLRQVEGNGPQTVGHIEKIRAILNN